MQSCEEGSLLPLRLSLSPSLATAQYKKFQFIFKAKQDFFWSHGEIFHTEFFALYLSSTSHYMTKILSAFRLQLEYLNFYVEMLQTASQLR